MDQVRVEWIGHAAVLVDSAEGPRVLFDPYESGGFEGRIRYEPIEIRPDIVAITHFHADHAHLSRDMRAARVVDRSCSVQGLAFQARPAYHDADGGARMGLVRILTLHTGCFRIMHPGDVGCLPADARTLGPVDLLLLPVGGNFTLGAESAAELAVATRARVVVPIHFRNACCTLPMAGVEPFVEEITKRGWPFEERHGSLVRLPEDLPRETEPAPRVILLEPSHGRPV